MMEPTGHRLEDFAARSKNQPFKPFSAPGDTVSLTPSRQSRPALFGKHAKRQFLAAQSNRLMMDWPTVNLSPDEIVRRDLRALRGRSRWLADNNGYYMKYIRMNTLNIVGPSGVRLESKVLKADGVTPDPEAVTKIEIAWREWSKIGNAVRRAKMTRTDLERVMIGSVVRDGEVFLRKWYGTGTFGFQIELIDPMRIPTEMNQAPDSNGIEIINGIKYTDGEVTSYFIAQRGTAMDYAGTKYSEVPAKYVEHLYFQLWAEQKRGIPWMASGMQRIHMMDRYEHAEVTAARIAAENGGGYFTSKPEVDPEAGFSGTKADGSKEYDDDGVDIEMLESEAGKFGILPEGYDFKQYDSNHPNSAFESLHSKLLRGIAASGDVPYFSFANDLGDVNYSSARIGLLEVRDNWQEKQQWFVNHFHEVIYPDWLNMAMASGRLNLTYADRWRYMRVSWAPRSWSWVDPQKEAEGNLKRIRMGAAAPSDVTAEQGKEFEEVIEQTARDKATADKYGITLDDIFSPEQPATPAQSAAGKNSRDIMARIEAIEASLGIGAHKLNGHEHA
jgi:lambda family phage portal protein